MVDGRRRYTPDLMDGNERGEKKRPEVSRPLKLFAKVSFFPANEGNSTREDLLFRNPQ